MFKHILYYCAISRQYFSILCGYFGGRIITELHFLDQLHIIGHSQKEITKNNMIGSKRELQLSFVWKMP